MIKGIHGLFFTPSPEELRVFLRDKLDLPYTDTGDGWLIFDLPVGEVGCHPADTVSHAISFYCDDIYQTVAELKSRGVEFTTGISSQEWGLVTTVRMPGNVEVDLYEPKYKSTLPKSPKRPAVRKGLRKTRRASPRAKPARR